LHLSPSYSTSFLQKALFAGAALSAGAIKVPRYLLGQHRKKQASGEKIAAN